MCTYFASYLLDRGVVSLKCVSDLLPRWPPHQEHFICLPFLFSYIFLHYLFSSFLPLIHNSLYFVVCLHVITPSGVCCGGTHSVNSVDRELPVLCQAQASRQRPLPGERNLFWVIDSSGHRSIVMSAPLPVFRSE